jgi:hypothetical protein
MRPDVDPTDDLIPYIPVLFVLSANHDFERLSTQRSGAAKNAMFDPNGINASFNNLRRCFHLEIFERESDEYMIRTSRRPGRSLAQSRCPLIS